MNVLCSYKIYYMIQFLLLRYMKFLLRNLNLYQNMIQANETIIKIKKEMYTILMANKEY